VSTAVFVMKRLLIAVVTALVGSFAMYAAMYYSPTSPLGLLLGGRGATPEQIAHITKQYHLDEGLLAQYLHWIARLLHGDLGRSLLYRDQVANLLTGRILTTFLLVTYAGVIIVVFGISLGLLAAMKPGRTDSSLRVVFSTAIAMPSFVVASLLILVFGVTWPIFPVFGSGTGLLDMLYHLTMPAIALALANIAYVGKIVRSCIVKTKNEEYVWAARARGLPESVVTNRHVMRNGLLPVITVIGITIAGLIAGAVVVETAFGLNGIGSLLTAAISQKDFAVAQVISLMLIITFVLMSTMVDILYGLVDPLVAKGLRGGDR
jgi:peptide/nickel transport system permease protein